MSKPLFISLADNSWQRAHYAFVLAASSLSIGRPVTLFAGGLSVFSLTHQWSNLINITPDHVLIDRNVASLQELRDACLEMGGVFLACEAGMALAKIMPEDLIDGVEASGMVRFLAEIGDNSMIVV
ncbi:DsrE/DsrF/DrsH-like family protein [Neokomagataea thailandica]|uniref:Peroxiredoxin n=1 Tax=Neokomagataea tanensis NBRC 106556 TaxID=1223519 RepID=A0ABQ0QJY1_9PROT|nr:MULTISPECIES: DsrE/DsrF/DrsH-like family protein [Neokomagataea]GBR47455.1 hypothetical protein AA106556_1457 [Neokomagataea tanensis NBRC 106556]